MFLETGMSSFFAKALFFYLFFSYSFSFSIHHQIFSRYIFLLVDFSEVGTRMNSGAAFRVVGGGAKNVWFYKIV